MEYITHAGGHGTRSLISSSSSFTSIDRLFRWATAMSSSSRWLFSSSLRPRTAPEAMLLNPPPPPLPSPSRSVHVHSSPWLVVTGFKIDVSCMLTGRPEHDRVGTAELHGEVRLVVRRPQLRGRAGAHRAAAGAGQQADQPPSWERWRRRLQQGIGGSADHEATVVVRRRRPLQLQAHHLEMQVCGGKLAEGYVDGAGTQACVDHQDSDFKLSSSEEPSFCLALCHPCIYISFKDVLDTLKALLFESIAYILTRLICEHT